MPCNEARCRRNASLLLERVLLELDEGAQGDVRHIIREVAHRAGVTPVVEALARDTWEALLAQPEDAKWTGRRLAMLALTQATRVLRAGVAA